MLASRPIIIGLLAAQLVAVGGCQFTAEQRLVGAWSADRSSTRIPTFPNSEIGERLKHGLDSSQLKLSADHTFIFTGLSQIGGTWSYKNDKITLTPSSATTSKYSALLNRVLSLKVDRDFSEMTLSVPTPFGEIRLLLEKTA